MQKKSSNNHVTWQISVCRQQWSNFLGHVSLVYASYHGIMSPQLHQVTVRTTDTHRGRLTWWQQLLGPVSYNNLSHCRETALNFFIILDIHYTLSPWIRLGLAKVFHWWPLKSFLQVRANLWCLTVPNFGTVPTNNPVASRHITQEKLSESKLICLGLH